MYVCIINFVIVMKVDLGVDSVGYDLTLILPFGQTSVYQYGGVESGIPANGQIQSSERSVTPFLPDLMDPTMCYLPSGYPSPAYYYGSKMMRFGFIL